MKPIRIFALVVAALLGGCGGGPQLEPLGKDSVIVAFGDSLTDGAGARENETYPAVLEKLSGITVINAGISGEESADGLDRLPGVLDEYQPDLLILCHGGNDLLRKKDLAKMEANIRRMIQMAQAKNIGVVLLGVPKPGLFLSSLEIYGEIAESTGVVYIEELVPDVLGDASLKSDTVHPNAQGYRVMAEHVYNVLKEAGAISS